MNVSRLNGLIAATYTPLREDGSLNLDRVGPIVEQLIADRVDGLYVCGSTGEGMSLSGAERRAIAEEYVTAVAGRVPVIIQVGHNSVAEASELAAHAQEIGADVVSATCPSYYPIASVDVLVACMSKIASGAPALPFYYYHIPVLTGSAIDMTDFMRRGSDQIANLVGLKYTAPTLHEYQQCMLLDDGRFDVLWGVDEMLLGALATGARGAIGSTYNIAAPLYRRIIAAFGQQDLDEARRLQGLAIQMIQIIARYPFHPAMKDLLRMIGLDCGGCRLPLPSLSPDDVNQLREQLTELGFFLWRDAQQDASVVPQPKMASMRDAAPAQLPSARKSL